MEGLVKELSGHHLVYNNRLIPYGTYHSPPHRIRCTHFSCAGLRRSDKDIRLLHSLTRNCEENIIRRVTHIIGRELTIPFLNIIVPKKILAKPLGYCLILTYFVCADCKKILEVVEPGKAENELIVTDGKE